MKKQAFVVLMIATISFSCSHPLQPTANDVLWYDEPAHIWEEYLPVGNGRLGLMPQGGVSDEHIVLNEISMWSGSEADYSNPQAAESLPRIRQLLFEGRNAEAQKLMYETFVPKATTCDTYGTYQMLADMHMLMAVDTTAQISNYKRILNMANGVATTDFTIGTNHIQRCYFASRAADVIVIRQKSTEPIDVDVQLSRPERGVLSVSGNKIVLSGELNSGQDSVSGVCYEALMQAQTNAKQCQVSTQGIHIEQATNIVIVLSATTSYLAGINYKDEAETLLSKALAANYDELLAEHSKLHNALYARVRLNIQGCGDTIMPTDERIIRYAQSHDPAMAVLYYNFGRYSLISSTREGSLPPNLQGLWANGCYTPWNGDYHTNINVQMNHWPLEQGNLDELYEPLIRLVENSVASGQKTAKDFYGADACGWVMHMMTNVWRFTAPGEHPSWGATNTGGAWLCQHLWERYEYTLDTAYLQRIYPIMRGAAEFFESTMVHEPSHQWLVTAPTSSPENSFYVSGSTEPVSVCMGPTMDTEIIRELYTNVVNAASILKQEDSFTNKLKTDIAQLPPFQISEQGYLMEWLTDYEESDVHHRHVSHLYGLHPSNQISPIETPDLAEACRQTLNRRGDEATGWSRAWKINFWARLFDGNRAEKLLSSLLSTAIDSVGKHHSGTFPNLWCSHPPFQLDGNYGGAAGIGEMLMQSHMGYICPLPALPDNWENGSVKGIKVRGGATVGMVWTEGKLQRLSLSGGKADKYMIVMPHAVSKVILMSGSKQQELEVREYRNKPSIEVTMNDGDVVITLE